MNNSIPDLLSPEAVAAAVDAVADAGGACVAGDSWMASNVDGDGDTFAFADALGVAAGERFAVSGSTSGDWLRGPQRFLLERLRKESKARFAVVSMGGNDAFAALRDGTLSLDEAKALTDGVSGLLREIGNAKGFSNTFLVLYANPWPGDFIKGVACFCLNQALAAAAIDAGLPPQNLIAASAVLGAEDRSGDLPGNGPHPSRDGYVRLAGLAAAVIARTLSADPGCTGGSAPCPRPGNG